jgi:two-component system, cell cycle response regulator DivK
MTILLADDNPGNREMARLALEAVGYEVIEAADGREALELARSVLPRLLIFDIQMPVLDGYGVIGELRQDDRFAATPAIAMTAFAMQGDEDKALAAGFTRHISKPVNLSNLRKIVAELLA